MKKRFRKVKVLTGKSREKSRGSRLFKSDIWRVADLVTPGQVIFDEQGVCIFVDDGNGQQWDASQDDWEDMGLPFGFDPY